MKGKEFDFSKIYLNTAPFMTSARQMYHTFGFIEREEYIGSELPEKMKPIWIFMEKKIN
jgi:hypothetical protein